MVIHMCHPLHKYCTHKRTHTHTLRVCSIIKEDLCCVPVMGGRVFGWVFAGFSLVFAAKISERNFDERNLMTNVVINHDNECSNQIVSRLAEIGSVMVRSNWNPG